MVAQRVQAHCPLSARTTTGISELTAMLSGLVQQRADQIAALLRQIGHARSAKATAKAALVQQNSEQTAILKGLTSKSKSKHISSDASLTAPPIHVHVSQPKKAPLTLKSTLSSRCSSYEPALLSVYIKGQRAGLQGQG